MWPLIAIGAVVVAGRVIQTWDDDLDADDYLFEVEQGMRRRSRRIERRLGIVDVDSAEPEINWRDK